MGIVSESISTVARHYKAGTLNWPMIIYISLAHAAAIMGLISVPSCSKATLLWAFILWPIRFVNFLISGEYFNQLIFYFFLRQWIRNHRWCSQTLGSQILQGNFSNARFLNVGKFNSKSRKYMALGKRSQSPPQTLRGMSFLNFYVLKLFKICLNLKMNYFAFRLMQILIMQPEVFSLLIWDGYSSKSTRMSQKQERN